MTCSHLGKSFFSDLFPTFNLDPFLGDGSS
jgi:hypothetical protein